MLRVVLGGVYGSPPPSKRKYRQYSPNTLTKAYDSVKAGELSVRKASKVFDVPMQTLRDRVLGHVDPETIRSGPGPLLSELEEARLVEHVEYMAKVGYPYTRAELINVASEFVSCLGRREREKPLSYKWFYGFLGRWPQLKIQRPKTVSDLRARATSQESIRNYFSELHGILVKYDLVNSPEAIYNVDEKGIQQNFKPSYVVGSRDKSTSVITSERSATTTILGCGNAIGQQIPPYFVFAGARMRPELLDGASPGVQGTVTKSGWSNGTVFQDYLETHFINYANAKRPLLLLYDGHRSHISPTVIDWATEHNVILYVLPPHTSHILQPMDVGCFGPFSKIYNNECGKFQRETGRIVDRYSVCKIACKAYAIALSVKNLQSAFKKSGLFPFCPGAVNTDLFESHMLRSELRSDIAEDVCQTDVSDHALPESGSDHAQPESDSNLCQPDVSDHVQPEMRDSNKTDHFVDDEVFVAVPLVTGGDTDKIGSFFKRKRPVFKPPFKTERRSISKIISGKAITEPETCKQVKQYLELSSAPKKSKVVFSKDKRVGTTVQLKQAVQNPSNLGKKNPAMARDTMVDLPVQSTSGIQTGGPISLITHFQSEDESSDNGDDEKCCMCGKLQPDELVNCPGIVFVKWAQCDICLHWTHLIYCSSVRVIRRGDIFKCPHCQ